MSKINELVLTVLVALACPLFIPFLEKNALGFRVGQMIILKKRLL